ncbi:MAG: 8-oxo-dGTP diphosphatase [Defluviitaleaceae bacterium]|nr:8-oxo-dGTP diphosphatase [Defluviitaleaceae bacterium]
MKLAALCYVEKDNQYLMIHRTKKENDMHKGLWKGLGGKFEPGESPEECVIREVYEESGLKIRNPQLKGILTFPNNPKFEEFCIFLFIAKDFFGDIISNEDCKEGDLAWLDKDKLDNFPANQADKYFLKWMQETEGIFSAKFIYDDNGILKDYQISIYK